MKKMTPCLVAIVTTMWTGCGNGLDDMNLTEQQKFLAELEGTWVGTAEHAWTVSGSRAIEFQMDLPEDGLPALEGLTGTVRFGGSYTPVEIDPDDPQIELSNDYRQLRDGYPFEMVDISLVGNRLLASFQFHRQWKEFCEAQTEIYEGEEGVYYSCGPQPPNWECPLYSGDPYKTCEGPNGEEVTMLTVKIDVCNWACECDASSCTSNHGGGTEMDITVDTRNGAMLGVGDLGRIEAVKQ